MANTLESPHRRLFVEDIHPRVLFGPNELPALRQRASVPGSLNARALAEVLRRAKLFTDAGSPRRFDPAAQGPEARTAAMARTDPILGQDLKQALHALAFAYAFTGEDQWARRAAPLLRLLCAPGGDHADFHAASLEGDLPIIFDLLAPGLEPADRQLVTAFIRRAMELYEQTVLTRSGTLWGMGSNIFYYEFEQYALMLAATFSHETDWPRLARVEELVRRGIHRGLDEGGAIYEGPSYGTGDALWLSTIAEILLRAGLANLWADEPRFAAMVRHWAYLILPGHRGQNPIGDAWRYKKGHPHWAAPMHAKRLGDDVLWWVWERMRSRTTQGPPGQEQPMPEAIEYRLGWTLIYEDESARVLNPGDADWPTAKNSGGAGQIVMRSGWGEEDIYFHLHASGRTPGCNIHQHVDAGHFSLFALGEAFSIDTGYGDITGQYHSVMMPRGQEPPHAPLDFDIMWRGGRVESFAAGRNAHAGCVDVHDAWDCRWAYRRALLVRAPGADPYVVIVDDFNIASKFGQYLWLINSEPGNRIEIDQPSERATIHGREHRLEIAWSHPGPNEYAFAHRLEFETDTIDSAALPQRTTDVNFFHGTEGMSRPRGGARWGAGVRPRLKATLWGFNGQLMSVLLPRRHGQAPVKASRICAPAQFGLSLDLGGGVTDTIVASPIGGGLSLAGLGGEAALAVIRRNAAGKVTWWAAADAYALTLEGQTLLPRSGQAQALAEMS